ncbi:hypothetical protein N3C_2639 [Clostridium sp. N3C]|uniref:hypothetical protein n=1 Tax=Clostridium sp. N3C TaxID=1776758 RepID=UPI00092E195B|nr:hypothetical protein [Clostridium sp. N3C]NLZ34621.1 hypothetical protein [Clostridiales bacterium]SCN26027.1 hypothetical protein N3C_2639 [Clostridium sp. N3C]
MIYDEKFKEKVIEDTIKGIIKIYGYSRAAAEKAVKESNLQWSIDFAPDMIAHCSLEQLVDMVIA